MKKFLLYILLFFGIVAVADYGFGVTCDWLQNHAKGGRMKGVRQSALEQTADVVVMGSSRAHHHYVCSVITENTGMIAHNAGIDGNGIVTATGLYEMMAERYTPKVIIYDVEPAFDINVYKEDGNNTRYIGWLRPYFGHPQVKKVICRIDPSERLKNLSAMFRYNGDIADLLKDQVVMSDYTADGYAPLQGEMKKEPVKKVGGGASVQDTLKLHMMEEFIARMSQSETKLIMVASPKYGATSSSTFNPIKEMCSRYGVEFWDYYTASEFQKMEYFKEAMHFNDKGAREFSKRIAHDLEQELKY
jgi:hypothetical protein